MWYNSKLSSHVLPETAGQLCVNVFGVDGGGHGGVMVPVS